MSHHGQTIKLGYPRRIHGNIEILDNKYFEFDTSPGWRASFYLDEFMQEKMIIWLKQYRLAPINPNTKRREIDSVIICGSQTVVLMAFPNDEIVYCQKTDFIAWNEALTYLLSTDQHEKLYKKLIQSNKQEKS